MKKFIYLALLAAMSAALASCTKEDVRGVSEDTSLSFSFQKPRERFQTRADDENLIATRHEWFIDTLDIYVADKDGVVGKLERNKDYTLTEDVREYTIVMTQDWIRRYATQEVDFYFVGNDFISDKGKHDALELTDETDFRNGLTNELDPVQVTIDGSDVDRLELIAIDPSTGINLLDGDTRGLLFSTSIPDVAVRGKVAEGGSLIRRVARFDIVNPMVYNADTGDSAYFDITRILVSNASEAGMIFGAGDATVMDGIGKMSHLEIPGGGISYTAWSMDADPDVDKPNMAQSVFYLYPTELGVDKTRIMVEASLGGEEPALYLVDASQISDQMISANERYILNMRPATAEFYLTVADWDTETLPTPPGKDAVFTISDWGGVADGSNPNWNLQNMQYEFDDVAGKTLTFTITSKYGTQAAVIPVVGEVSVPAAVKKNTVTTYADLGHWTVEEYTIDVPAGGAGKINVVIASAYGEAHTTIVFTRLWGGYADILYFADDGTLQIGQWGEEIDADNYLTKMAFFQFGSVVGFTNDATTWDASEIKYNPTSGSYADYTTIPHFVAADWNAGIRNLSDTATYHTLANLKAGKGDPCMLVGLTAAEVAAMTEEEFAARNSGWRLPTVLENKNFVGGPAAATWDGTTNYNYATSAWNNSQGDASTVNPGNPYDFFTAGSPGVGKFPVVAGYAPANNLTLPAAGYSNSTIGVVTNQGTDGYWWSSTPYNDGSRGHNLYFGSNRVNPVTYSNYSYGFSIRCVNPSSTEVPEGAKEVELPLPVVPVDPANPILGSNDIMYLDASGKLAVGRWGDPNVTLSNLLYFKFGGVIGFDGDDTSDAGWGFDDIKFNPTPLTATDITAYTTDPFDAEQSNALPRVPGFVTADWDKGIRSVSSADYHTFSNIKAGKGDPCQLIGLTAAQIAGAQNAAQLIDLLEKRPAEAKGWRLPSAQENALFIGGPAAATWNGVTSYNYENATYSYYTAGPPVVGRFPVTANGDIPAFSQTLPAAGYRLYTTGVVTGQDIGGLWWSSTPASATGGRYLHFDTGSVYPVHNSSYSYGFSVRCVKEGVEAITSLPAVSTAHTPGQADILYFDGSSLAIGKWGTNVSNTANLAHFKFGGVIGFNNVDAWSFDDIKFNPTPLTSAEITAYSTDPFDAATSNALPRVPGFVSQDYTDGIRDLSGAAYHTFINIKAGKGDPCQLIGLTAAQIAGATTPDALAALLHARPAADKGWRLPTAKENIDFVGGPVTSSTWDGVKNYNYRTSAWAGDANTENTSTPYNFFTANTGNASDPGVGRFPVVANDNPVNSQTLPAAGYRAYTSGAVTSQGTNGYWWSSTPYSGSYGHYLSFYSTNVPPVNSSYSALGFSVRCVKPAS